MLAELPYHGIDPVLISVWLFDVRYYGLGYVVGFLVATWILRGLARRNFFPGSADQAGDLLFLLVLGVILGARLGFVLFYDQKLLLDPFGLIAIWKGGLSFHGGLLGVTLAALYYARKQGIPFLRLGDCLTLAATPGIFLVRIANFINGELYGRIAPEGLPWAMRFPRSPEGLEALREFGALPSHSLEERLEGRIIQNLLNDGTWERVAHLVPPRHPSQIYQALGEGLLLGLALMTVFFLARRRGWKEPYGLYMVLFIGGYGVVRFLIENYRQPDAHIGFDILGLTRGQILCSVMVLVAVALGIWIARKARA